MGLKEVLSKMKLVEIDPPPPAFAAEPRPSLGGAPRPPAGAAGSSLPPPPPDIQELLGKLPEAPEIDEKKLPPEVKEGDEIPDFTAIYKAAGVAEPAHGYTAYKVLEIFSSPGFAVLDTRAKAAALSGFLQMNPTGPVPVTDIVQDAVQRDQALDKFEGFLKSKLAARSEEIDKENAALQAEIDEITRRNREKMEANRAALEMEQARLSRWQIMKRVEERKLFEAVNPFVESNPISTGDSPRSAAAPTAPPEETPNQT
jgi:Skp family chaperone for outer membrane proteins